MKFPPSLIITVAKDRLSIRYEVADSRYDSILLGVIVPFVSPGPPLTALTQVVIKPSTML